MHTKETDILFSQQASLQSNQMVDMVFRYLCSLSAGDYIYRSVHGKGQQRPERKRRHRIHHRTPYPPPLHFYQIDIRYAKPITDKTTAQTELTVQTLLAEHTEQALQVNLGYRLNLQHQTHGSIIFKGSTPEIFYIRVVEGPSFVPSTTRTFANTLSFNTLPKQPIVKGPRFGPSTTQ